MNSKEFKVALVKMMPGYKWTVHQKNKNRPCIMEATGIQSSGFNRLSTLNVVRREENGIVEHEVKSAGFGSRASWLSTYKAETLAMALRGLQKHYESMASTYQSHAGYLEYARAKYHKET